MSNANAHALPRAYSHVGNSGLVRLCVPGLSLTGDRIGPRGPEHTVLIGPALATFPGSPTRGPRVTLSLCPGLVCVAPSGQAYGRLAAGLILPVSLALVSSANACALPRAYSHVGNSGLVRLCTSRLGPQTGDLKCPRGPRHTVLTGPVLATVCHWSTREPRVTLSLCPGLVCVAPSGQVHGRLAAGLILRGPLSLLSAANATALPTRTRGRQQRLVRISRRGSQGQCPRHSAM